MGELHILACKRHLEDLKRQGTKEFPYIWDPEKSERILQYAETLPGKEALLCGCAGRFDSVPSAVCGQRQANHTEKRLSDDTQAMVRMRGQCQRIAENGGHAGNHRSRDLEHL